MALDEYSRLVRVAMRHARDAFRDQAFIDRSWRALGYRAAPDYRRALGESDALAALLDAAAVDIAWLPAADGLTLDAIYARDAAVVSPRGVIACAMGKPARAAEPAITRDHFAALGAALGVPVAGAIAGGAGGAGGGGGTSAMLEGGDVVWLDAGTCLVGEGYRTDPAGIAALRALLPADVDVIACPLPHHRGPGDVFHLMSVLSPLDRDLALVYPRLMPVRLVRALADRGVALVEVPDDEFEIMGANALALAPRWCLLVDGMPETRRRLEAAGCRVTVYAGDEISRKGDGGPTCLTRPLVRTAG